MELKNRKSKVFTKYVRRFPIHFLFMYIYIYIYRGIYRKTNFLLIEALEESFTIPMNGTGNHLDREKRQMRKERE